MRFKVNALFNLLVRPARIAQDPCKSKTQYSESASEEKKWRVFDYERLINMDLGVKLR